MTCAWSINAIQCGQCIFCDLIALFKEMWASNKSAGYMWIMVLCVKMDETNKYTSRKRREIKKCCGLNLLGANHIFTGLTPIFCRRRRFWRLIKTSSFKPPRPSHETELRARDKRASDHSKCACFTFERLPSSCLVSTFCPDNKTIASVVYHCFLFFSACWVCKERAKGWTVSFAAPLTERESSVLEPKTLNPDRNHNAQGRETQSFYCPNFLLKHRSLWFIVRITQ